MTIATSKRCRKCGEPLLWNKTIKEWRECDNGCSQYTAAIPDNSELTYTRGESKDGVPVYGGAVVRKPTCHD